MDRRNIILDITSKKGKSNIVAMTCYSAQFAPIFDKYADILLVGDSLGMIIYGFENTIKVDAKNINQFKKNKFLDFLTIETHKMPDNNYEMKIVFSGDSVIKVLSEVIEVTLDDQGEAWNTKNIPKHKEL